MFGFKKREENGQSQKNDLADMYRAALDHVQEVVMICDMGTDCNVIYLNSAGQNILSQHRSELKERLTGFDPGHVQGQSIHRMHPDNSQSRRIIEDIRHRKSRDHTTDITFGSYVVRATYSPIYDPQDSLKVAGIAVSWQDISLAAHNESLQKQADAKRNLQEQVEQIAGAVEGVSTSVGEVASHAFQSLERADNVLSSVQRGKDVVQDVVEEMQRIAGLVRSTADSVQKLGTQSERIGVVVGVIKEIADQTNLLALNAAIEAARAGEAGRGFAVVADEVRKLSERTAKATSEISGTIQTIQSDIQSAVGAMGSGQERVVAGEQKASTANDALDVIVHDMKAMRDLICDISRAVEQQAGASNNVSKRLEAISSMD